MINKYLLDELRQRSDEKGELARWVIHLQADLDTERRKTASQDSVICARDKRIAELEAYNAKLRDWNAGLAQESCELQAKLATPVRLLGQMLVHDWEHRVDRQAAFEHRKTAWDARLEEDKKAIRAAGFTFIVEGDE
ncbi:hypothetical protein [Serratia liquefaciens]|uniref:Uncharacterized protein n=1 Tax=Serratia liquefaciens TaxID=614 RepID=A0A515CTG6_SERLI|nr:hypothetical protein [Serratia liquefaciens]QDL31465.1 hypothetical protein EGO53_06575 [Serratia liquefaciens]